MIGVECFMSLPSIKVNATVYATIDLNGRLILASGSPNLAKALDAKMALIIFH